MCEPIQTASGKPTRRGSWKYPHEDVPRYWNARCHLERRAFCAPSKSQPGATIGRNASSDPVVLNPNINIPKYDGTEDPRPWIESLEEIGFLYHWADYIISRYAAMNMIGSAKTWLNLHKISFTSWENFKSRLIDDFASDANKEEMRMRLNRMQQWNEPAIRFAEDILVLCNKVDPQMEEETKINWVFGGLKKEYSFALHQNPPKNTNELLEICKKLDLFEKNYQERVEKSKALYNGPRSPRPHHQEQWKNAPSFRRPYQNTSKPQAPAPRYYQNTSKPQAPTPRYYQNKPLPQICRIRRLKLSIAPESVNQSKSTINGIKKLDPKYKMNINVDRIDICEALIDTGADLSVVDLSTALNTGLEIINPDKMCSGPDGKELDIVGNIILNIKFDDKTITHQFVIMRTHLRIFILGRDFLKKMNAKIDCQREIIKYDLTENRDVIKYQQKKIKSAKDAIIPELSIKLINAFVEAEDGEYIIEENHKMFQTNGLRLARSLINVVNKETYIWITNPYPRPLKILKNQTLCFGSQPAEVYLIEESEQKEHEEPQFQINKNLSYKEKEQLKQVLDKYADLFSSGLGRSNLAKHRIDTEGAKPIKHKPYREIKDLESKNKAIVESKNIHRLKLFQQEVNERKISLNQVINTLLESELDETQYEDYSKAKDDIFNMLVSIEEALSLIETKENTHSDKQLPESNVNLPKINLPIFNGDSANWLSFREIFNSTINSNQTLTEIQKFQYLNVSVKGPAEKLIRGFPISEKNYQQAWDTLCNRFNNRRELAFSQINKIFSIRPLKSISAGSLYEILDVCNEGIRNLSVLGLEKNTLTDLILINFFEKRIGEALRKEWELTLQNEEYPTFENFVNFLEKHARSLQGMRIPLFQEQKTSSKNMMAHGLYVNKGQNCILCHQIHKLNDCQRFINLPLPKKWELVKKHKLCQNCLRANHEISKCLITSRCKNCKQNHHTLLHEYNSEPSIPQPTTSQEMLISTNTICNVMPLETETNILLSTALIKVKVKDGSFVLCRALVDNGSQISLISEQCCHKLGLEKRKNSYTLKGVGDIVVNRTTSQVEIEFTPHHNDQLFAARAFVVGRVTADLPNFQIQSADFPHLENLLLADPEFYVTKPIDLILGADTFVEIILGYKTDLKHHPIALNTKLGWLVSGRIHSTIKSNTSVVNHCSTELDSSRRKFWELEDVPISKAQLGIKNAPSPSLQESIQNSPSLKEFTQNSPSLQESIQNSPSLKEFTQNFPSLPGSIQTSPSLPDSVQGSPSLTLSLQSSKHNSPTPLQVSVHSLKEAMSPLVEMPSSPGCSKQIPIPIEEDSIESQNRVDNLPSYPMSPEQSYTLSSASVEDFKAQSGPKSPTSPTRGSESCRCSGNYTEPQMSQNSNFSCSSIEESEDNSSKSEENLSRSEDNPSKSEEIPSKSKKSRISKLTPQITTKQNQLLPSESSQPSTPEQPLASQSSEPLSSKKETSIIPKIKPPPYYRRKRQLPAEKTSWDEPIESDIKSNWNKFQTQLSCLKEIKIPTYLNSSSSEIEELQLHGFCDASLNAYSAVFYLKTRFKNQKIKINLITSKTKVAPLKTITIPRLELSAALLLAQLNQVILESFPFQPDKTFLWTDSQICIDWIRSDASRWKAFVSNRVSSIQNLTQITDWFHVSSQDNPADCASRGIMPQDLVNHRIWWRGPIWLQENNVRYIPSSPTQVNLNIIQEEVGEGQVLDQTTLIQNSETMLNLEFIERYSTMTKLIRITAWCWRFYYNCLLFDPIRQKGPLTRELTKAIQVLVKSIQQVEFCTEIKLLKSNKQLPLSNKLTSLNPFLDTQGLLRVGGRLKYSYLNENKKFPLLQPKSPRQESLIKNLLTENADIPEAIDENQEDSSILETTFIIEDEESNKDIGTPKIEISEVSVIDKSEGKYSKEPVVSAEALDKKELCHDDSAHLNVVEADLNRPKEATSGIINVYTEANESSSKEKVVPVEIVDTSTKDYLQSGEKAKLSRWKPIDSLCLEDVKESEDDDENYSSSAYIEWPEILKKEVLRPEALEKAVNLEDFEKAAESRQLSKEHLEESTEQGSCIKAESKTWEDPIESDLAAAESDNPAVPERELANESENLIQDSPQSDTQRWKLIPLPFKQ
ncbi:hypothetical protein LAZ67_23002041 [Cordylochernes scorpioides]|uniref:Peptidase A2 domain-containing protein n=1 Tax=Cordylochernes scorpioides TaxID=51811 RepID=A0ABY6LTK2_9ARAC|nr:hypothetical protein LAZ67_23002041 [Cordylochernes scorpioides]